MSWWMKVFAVPGWSYECRSCGREVALSWLSALAGVVAVVAAWHAITSVAADLFIGLISIAYVLAHTFLVPLRKP